MLRRVRWWPPWWLWIWLLLLFVLVGVVIAGDYVLLR